MHTNGFEGSMRRLGKTRSTLSRLWRKPRQVKEVTVAMWGAAGVGKTSLLSAMESAARHEGISIYSADVQTEAVIRHFRQTRNNHRFPASTVAPASAEELPLLRFGLRFKRSKREFMLNIADAAGSWWLDSSNEAHQPTHRGQRANRYEIFLSKCDGILCIIDPTHSLERAHLPEIVAGATLDPPLSTELQTMLAQLRFTMLQGQGLLDTKIAICLTHMDRPEHYGHLGKEKQYFQHLYGVAPLDNWVAHKRWKFFGCSAVGVLRRAGYLISNTYQDNNGQHLILDPSVPPINVFGPLKWILGNA